MTASLAACGSSNDAPGGGADLADGGGGPDATLDAGGSREGGDDAPPRDGETDAATDARADAAPWVPDPGQSAKYICAPSTRTVRPVAVFKTTGTVTNAPNLLAGQAATLAGAGALATLDFGTEVGGTVSLAFPAASDASQRIGLAFSESSLYAGPSSDQSNGSGTADGYVSVPVSAGGSYTLPDALLRGGFRYLTVFLVSSGSVDVSDLQLAYTPDPDRATPNQYPNYFYSNDETLNKAWYAGAYTFQTNVLRPNQGRAWPPVSTNWNNANVIGESGDVVLTDGAKRDRTVWPGDMAVSVPTGFAALFDSVAAKNSLTTLYNHQDAQGQLPYAGPPMNFGGSDTYHMWTLFGTYLEWLYGGDVGWLQSVWPKFKLGVAFLTAKVDANGLVSVTGNNDWARDGQGGENVAANALFYGVLVRGAALAGAMGDSALQATYASQASALKDAINARLWDSSVGAYKDNPTSALYPQDGNALAAWLGVPATASQARGLSYVLNENWGALGARGPEFTIGSGRPKISPFAGSMELFAHAALGYDRRALAMIRREWGFMLSSPNGTGCTFWEGYDTDGTFAYDDFGISFTSLAHGWSTGPTSTLTFSTLGVATDAPGGASYHVVPHPGDLTHVEGSLTVATGKSLAVQYDVGASCASFVLRVNAASNTGSTGTIAVPKLGASHVVQVDGATAWDGAAFVATPGIAGAREDADYVYFAGVAPADRVYAWSDGHACPAPPEEWSFCADEGAACAFAGTKRVRFGKQGKYSYALVTGGTPCDVASFGGVDPAPNVLKSCAVTDALFALCAAEGATCTAGAGVTEVRFGANGQWVSRAVTAGDALACDAATFGGDPIANVVKRCEAR